MKSIIISLMVLISAPVYGQTPCGDSSGLWHLEKGNTELQLIFALPDSVISDSLVFKDSCYFKKNILAFIKGLGHVENLLFTSEPYTFDIKGIKVDYKKYGFTSIDITSLNSPMDCKCIIEFKDDRYRISFKDFIWHETAYIMYQFVDRDTYLNDMFFNNQGCLKRFYLNSLLNTLEAMEKYLYDYFYYTVPTKPGKSDW